MSSGLNSWYLVICDQRLHFCLHSLQVILYFKVKSALTSQHASQQGKLVIGYRALVHGCDTTPMDTRCAESSDL